MKTAYRQILVHADNSHGTRQRLALARRIAHEQGSAIAALYAATPAYARMAFVAEMGASIAATLEREDAERRAAAKASFDADLDNGSGPRATWAESTAFDPQAAFAQQALLADLLILGQDRPDNLAAGDVPRGFAPTVMAASGKPALLLPYVGEPPAAFDTIAIAWKPSREAAAALSAALPLLQRARRVVVMQWRETPEAPPASGSALRLDHYLALHGVQARVDDEAPAGPEQVGDFMLSRCADHGADLLVMGCFGHSRAREWVLGGASRTVLASMTLPVLMAH